MGFEDERRCSTLLQSTCDDFHSKILFSPYPNTEFLLPSSVRSSALSSSSSSTCLKGSFTPKRRRRRNLQPPKHMSKQSRSFYYTYRANFTIVFILLLLMLTNGGDCKRNKCSFPKHWRGNWFISGISRPIIINATSIHSGNCEAHKNDRYLLYYPEYNCYRCLFIQMKHKNVLQYKQSYCSRERTIESNCAYLAGDAVLDSLFRIEAQPVPCPFQQTYVFTYNRGQGECKDPPSTVFSCTDDSRLLFGYQACPDIHGTESKDEEVVCLAQWKDGSNRYLVGKLEAQGLSDEDRYRCYVFDSWEKGNESGFKVAQSGDATCHGLFSISDGSKTLKLTKVNFSGSRCKFPSWVGSVHWHSLDGKSTLKLTTHNSTLLINGFSTTGGGPATLSCFKQEESTYVTSVTHGCHSGYQCVQLVNRDSHVLELKLGTISPLSDPDAACSRHYFDATSDAFTTFISSEAKSRSCPGNGRYDVLRGEPTAIGNVSPSMMAMGFGSCEEDSYTGLSVGCSSKNTLQFHSTCANSEFSCHGWWEDGGSEYVVVTPLSRSSTGARKLCLIIDRGEKVLSVSFSTQSCNKEHISVHHGKISLNTTSRGGCREPADVFVINSSSSFRQVIQYTEMFVFFGMILWIIGPF